MLVVQSLLRARLVRQVLPSHLAGVAAVAVAILRARAPLAERAVFPAVVVAVAELVQQRAARAARALAVK